MIFIHTGHGVRNLFCAIHGSIYRDLEQRGIYSLKSETGKKTAKQRLRRNMSKLISEVVSS